MALALDGSAHGNTGAGTTVAVTLNTTQSNDVLIAMILSNSAPVISVVGTSLTWTQRATVPGGAGDFEEWWAIASSPLSGEVITVTQTGVGFMTVDIFGISGANTVSPFDSGGPVTGTVDPLSITTVNANTMVVGGFGNPTHSGSGYTLISGADFQMTEYEILTSAQTISVTVGAPDTGTSNRCIADAVVAASGGGDVLMSQIWL